jgi:hypothetical protein
MAEDIQFRWRLGWHSAQPRTPKKVAKPPINRTSKTSRIRVDFISRASRSINCLLTLAGQPLQARNDWASVARAHLDLLRIRKERAACIQQLSIDLEKWLSAGSSNMDQKRNIILVAPAEPN